ncbi:hypothetical protein BRD56_10805 [Thermoplasmatales archaeon SW_10_69_26]|nr:MAG: hypothetical protein BRD56_10805 [Thermoplasmatales archaeon SW_10_69_26]
MGAEVDLGAETDTPEPAPQPSPTGAAPRRETPASFWRRLGAYLLDAVVIFVATTVAAEAILGGQPPADIDPLAPAALDELWPYYALNGVIAWTYFASFESSTLQATLGKHLLGLQVTDEQGEPISFLRATGRYVGKLLSALPLGLGFLMVFSSERNQALHDHLASCLVLEREDPDASLGPTLEGPGGGWEP